MDWIITSHEDWFRMSRRRPITVAQAHTIIRQARGAKAVAPVAQTSCTVRFRNQGASSVDVVGTTDKYIESSGTSIAQGRFISPAEADGGRPVCVLGATVASNLFKAYPPVGERLAIDNRNFEVVGVFEPVGGMFSEGSVDNQVIVPLNQFLAAFYSNPDVALQVKTDPQADISEAREELRSVVRAVRRLAPTAPDDFSINQQDQIVAAFHRIAGSIAAVGLFITGLSLFVGGIGIMNIMFVSVAERTKEIGIRKAIGARRRTILIQFLVEAGLICVMGGCIGLAIAWPATLGMARFLPASLSPMIVGIALTVAATTGLVSGFLPAWRASRLDPVEALRSE
jgi:putative ABC transport system permease protein